MTEHIYIEFILPQGTAPAYSGFAILGHTAKGQQNVQVYYEMPAIGVMSANLTTVSDQEGKWKVAFLGDFTSGIEITAYARNGTAELARLTKVL